MFLPKVLKQLQLLDYWVYTVICKDLSLEFILYYFVDRIMFPEVPIALRMSGHLLLGVVRIFSKQVDYFSRDCKVLLTELNKAYASSNVNLPENVTRATEEAVTLPNNFRLDAMELDDDFHTKR